MHASEEEVDEANSTDTGFAVSEDVASQFHQVVSEIESELSTLNDPYGFSIPGYHRSALSQ